MTRRYELTPEQFAMIEDLLPANGKRGGQWNDHLKTLNGILWILHTGAQWRELPERYGKWKSVHDRLSRWRADGTFDRILERLHMKLDERGLIDHDLWCVDATNIRASRAAAGAGGKKGPRRAPRPRPRPLPRRLRHQAASDRRRQRTAPLGHGDGRSDSRIEVAGAGARSGADQASRPGPSPPPTEAAGGGQGI